jgi:hypothetical protein
MRLFGCQAGGSAGAGATVWDFCALLGGVCESPALFGVKFAAQLACSPGFERRGRL